MAKREGTQFYVGELANGLKSAVVSLPGGEVVELRVYVRAGSVYEEEFCGSGISHFTEHIAAEGPTKRKSKKEVRKLIEDFGNAFNAYTCKDHTAYHITTTKEHFADALSLLGELVFENRITRASHRRERGVILREIEQSLQDPGSFLSRLGSENLYRLHPGRYPVIGKTENFKNISYRDILSYYRRMYVPGNALVAVGGALEQEKVLGSIEKVFGSYRGGNYYPPVLPEEPPLISRRRRRAYRDIEGSYLMLSWLSVKLTHEDLFAVDLLSEILSGARNSRLNLIVKEEKQLVNSISSYSHTPLYGKGSFAVRARLKDGDTSAAERAVLEIILDIRENGVRKEELEKARKLALSTNLLKKTSPSGLTARAGADAFATGSADFTDTYIRALRDVKAEDVRRVAEKYLSLSAYAKTEILPRRNKKKKKKSAKKTEEKKAQKIRLNSGARLILEEVGGISVIYYSVFFKGGLTYDKCFKSPGLFRFLSSMLWRGSENYGRRELSEEFEKRGAKFTTGSGYNSFYLSAFSLREDMEDILELIREIIYRPAFEPGEVEKQRKFQLQAIAQEKNSPQSEAYLNFKKHIFPPDLPYSTSANGTPGAVEKIDPGKLKEAHRIFTCPENTVISVSGDFNAQKLIRSAEKNFTPPSGAAAGEKIPDYPAKFVSPEKEILKTHPSGKKDLAVIFTGYPTVSTGDFKQRAVLDVIDALVSGAGYPGGWLHNRLREKELVYAAGGGNINFLKSGVFMVYAATTPLKIKETRREMEKVLKKLQKGKFKDKEIERAKDQILTMRRLSRQTPSARAKNYALNELLSLGYDFDQEYTRLIGEVTGKDINRIAAKFFKTPLTVITAPGPE